MWSRVWSFLRDKGNRRILTLVGVVVVVIGGLWTAFVFVSEKAPPRTVSTTSPIESAPSSVAESQTRPKILETGYSLLKWIGGEQPGYGLYSYAILITDDGRSAEFLGNVLVMGIARSVPWRKRLRRRLKRTYFTYL